MTVLLSDAAARRINTVLASDGKGAVAVRLQVLGGGCSGFQYKFSFANKIEEADDTVFEHNGAKLLIDSYSMGLVKGCTVDFTESLTESAFKVINPNATASCGCGTSFAV